MKSIWKFPLDVVGRQTVSVPKGAKFLSAAMQGDTLCAWAEVKTSAEHVEIPIFIFGTGHSIPRVLAGPNDTIILAEDLKFLATAHHPRLQLVWHIYVPRECAY